MNLADLRPTQPTELSLLSQSIRGKSVNAAVPSALPEHFLLSVARDLRMMEVTDQGEHPSSYLAAPMMLVFFLHMNKSSEGRAELRINEDALYRSLHVYQWAVEREIVKRLVGLGGDDDEQTLLERLESTLLSDS